MVYGVKLTNAPNWDVSMKSEVDMATANWVVCQYAFSFATNQSGLDLTLLSQLEEPPSETPFARKPRGKTSEMMIQATGPQLMRC